MFERFTPKARQVVVLAQEEARRLQHNYIGTEHLLLGLLAVPDGIGGQVLTGFGLSLDDARLDVVSRVGTGKKQMEGHIPFTPRAKKTLEFALREALALKHNYIGTEHVLLGLVRESDGVGAEIIAAHAPEPVEVRVRMAVLDLLPSVQPETGRRWFRRRSVASPDDQTEPAELDTTPAADSALREAARLAGREPVGSQHLMLAALADPDSAAARVLTTMGVDLDVAKRALEDADTAGTSDESPEAAGGRRVRMHVGPNAVTIEVTDPILVDLGRATLEVLGNRIDEADTIPGELAAAGSFREVWRVVRDSLDDICRRASSETPAPESPDAA